MFSEFDKIIKLDAFLYDLKFGMAIANFKKIFDLFFARFISAITLLNFTNWYKISNF